VAYSVYDEVPTGSAFPYITLGNPTSVPFEARGVDGQIVRFAFNCWTRDTGGKWQANQMIDAIIQSITADVITITGYKIIKMDFGTSRVYREEKGLPIDYTGELSMEFWVGIDVIECSYGHNKQDYHYHRIVDEEGKSERKITGYEKN